MKPLRLALLGLALTGLAACGGSGGGGVQTGLAALGAAFNQAFAQSATDTPVDVTTAGLNVDVTAEPFSL